MDPAQPCTPSALIFPPILTAINKSPGNPCKRCHFPNGKAKIQRHLSNGTERKSSRMMPGLCSARVMLQAPEQGGSQAMPGAAKKNGAVFISKALNSRYKSRDPVQLCAKGKWGLSMAIFLRNIWYIPCCRLCSERSTASERAALCTHARQKGK